MDSCRSMNGDFTACAIQLLQNSLATEILSCLSFVLFLQDIASRNISPQQKTLRTYRHESQWALALPETAGHYAAQASSQTEQHKA